METERLDVRLSRFNISLSVGQNTMAGKTSQESAKVAKRAAPKESKS
jgi:hypothetical protein